MLYLYQLTVGKLRGTRKDTLVKFDCCGFSKTENIIMYIFG